MILADSSIWIDHFHGKEPRFVPLLKEDKITLHPMVLGELWLGRLPRRQETLTDLKRLIPAETALESEVLNFVEAHRLAGSGIGWVDAHLLISCRLGDHELWTRDKKLTAAARMCGIKIRDAA